MADTDPETDEALRRMLATKPKPHKPKDEKRENRRGDDAPKDLG